MLVHAHSVYSWVLESPSQTFIEEVRLDIKNKNVGDLDKCLEILN